jgi:hypothetical protein
MDLVSIEGQEENNIVFRLIQQGQLYCALSSGSGALCCVTNKTLLSSILTMGARIVIKIMFLGSTARSARKADNPTAICEPIVCEMWEPRRFTSQKAPTAYYRDSFTLLFASLIRIIASS